MTKESEITPFSAKSSSTSTSNKRLRVASSLKWAGLAGFWIQLVFGVVSTVTLLLAMTNRTERNSAGTGFSLFCAACALICLIIGIYFSFRYQKMSRLLAKNDTVRPKKTDTFRIINIGLIISLVGIFLAILGAEAISGIVLTKILAFGQGEVLAGKDKEFVNSLDVFIIQANINIIGAHFAGLLSSLWLLSRIDK